MFLKKAETTPVEQPEIMEVEENAAPLNTTVVKKEMETPKQEPKSEEKNTSRSGRVIKRKK